MTIQLYHGDCLEVMATFDANSIDAIVTDPPAGISFMGKGWDHDHGGRDAWIANMAMIAAECLRVLKPGGHALVWALPRTSHWTATAWENAGFEVRDRVAHVFGSGFPKSQNAGNGWGTALKPAVEDWWLLRKPFRGTVAANVLEWGTGAINVDACRVEGVYETRDRNTNGGVSMFGTGAGGEAFLPTAGRFPANLIHDGSDEVRALFPVTGPSKATSGVKRFGRSAGIMGNVGTLRDGRPEGHDDPGGSASRFFAALPPDDDEARVFYCAKASKRDRDEGCEGLEARNIGERNGYSTLPDLRMDHQQERKPSRNGHPCVKATALMRYLCRLITPPGGTVLDPFMGSGSTGKAAALEGFDFVGIEQDAEYIEIARRRIDAATLPLLAVTP